MNNEAQPKDRMTILCVLLALVFLVLGFHYDLLNGWWRGDDTQILKFSLLHKPWDYFFIPEVWQELSASNLTPWVALSYEFDLALFDLNTVPFYIHHLIILWLTLALTFLLLKLWLKPLFAGLGAVLFACGAPFFFSAQILYTRHYWEGLIFAILALYLFVRAVRDQRPMLSWLGAAFFLLAVSAKELYVPLVVILPFLLEKNLTHRLRAAVPFVLVASLYVGWRWYMLGHPVGGYSHLIAWGNILALPINISAYIFGNGVAGCILISGTILTFIFSSKDKWRAGLLSIVITVAVLGPLIPIASLAALGLHYPIVLWWAVCCLIAVTLSRFSYSSRTLSIGLTLYALILGPVLYQAWGVKEAGLPGIYEMEEQGKFVWNNKEGHALLATPALARTYWYLSGLQWLQQQTGDEPVKTTIFVDELQLSQVDLNRTKIWSYQVSCGCLVNLSKKVPDILRQWEARKVRRSLSFMAEYENNLLSLQFGPYDQGTYHLIITGGGKRLFPKTFRVRARLSQRSFYVRYDSPEGWVTYSLLLHFNAEHGSNLNWKRTLPLQ